MPPSLSVILCTYNPRADYLARTMAGLRAQTLPFEAWELVVVDNRSEPPLEGRLDLSWHPRSRLVREETLGLTPARLRGIREAAGDLLVFVDDDNVLDPDYLAVARQVAEQRPFLGAWSGQCRPGFETAPPEWTRRYWGNLALREFDRDSWSNLPRLGDTMPCGAGLCIRREVARHYLHLNESGQRKVQFDRTGGSLMSGGDNDMAACACTVGLGVGLVAALKLQHLMPADRLTADYLTRLAEGIHFSSTLLDAEWGLPVRRPGLARRLADWWRAKLLGAPHGRILAAANRGRDKALQHLAAQARAG